MSGNEGWEYDEYLENYGARREFDRYLRSEEWECKTCFKKIKDAKEIKLHVKMHYEQHVLEFILRNQPVTGRIILSKFPKIDLVDLERDGKIKFFEPDMSWTLPNYQSKESTTNENLFKFDSLLGVPCINCVFEKTCSIESKDGNPHNCELILDWVSGKDHKKENEKNDDDYFDVIGAVVLFFGKSKKFNFVGKLEENEKSKSSNRFVIRDKEFETVPIVFEYYDEKQVKIGEIIKMKNVRLSGSGSNLKMLANFNSIVSN